MTDLERIVTQRPDDFSELSAYFEALLDHQPAEAVKQIREIDLNTPERFNLMSLRAASGSTWTDAYLAAFALETNSRLISFDRGMDRWPGLALELLTPA